MPLGATTIAKNPDIYEQVKRCLRLDLSAGPTYLRFSPDHGSLRIPAGSVAGSLEHGTKDNYIVTVQRTPIHCRHAVWMLANDENIPEGYDIAFADGQRNNLHPDNLVLVERANWRVPAPKQPEQWPHAVTFRRSRVKQHDATHLVLVHVGREQHPIHLCRTAEQALAAAAMAAHLFGYLPGQPSGITTDVATSVRSMVNALDVPPAEPDTARYARSMAQFLSCIKQEMQAMKPAIPESEPAPVVEPVRPVLPPPDMNPELRRIIFGESDGQA